MEPPGPAPEQVDPAGQPAGVQRYNDWFMMYVFKVEMCKRVDKHDREKCPYAHPGELARRRHPSLYQALPCPEARAKKICPRLENCNCSHSTFEFWLHPDRYKTFLCERGANCNRPICFFAHTENELRELPQGLQRTKPTHKSHHSSSGGVGSSRQAAAGVPTGNVVLVPGPAGQAVAAQQAYVQQQGGEQQGQLLVGYAPVAQQQPHQLVLQQQGLQYVAVPVQQGPRGSEPGLDGSTQSLPVLVRQGQVLYAPAPPGAEAAAGEPGAQQQGPLYPAHQPQMGYAMQSAGQASPLYGSGVYPRPQVLIGYQPVQMANMPGYAGPQGVVMVRPGQQRTSTVAVIPAGPSAWSSGMSAETGEAPSLEALCAAVTQMGIPTTDSSQQPELLLQQYHQPPPYQQSSPGQPQQQMQGQVPASGLGPQMPPPPPQQQQAALQGPQVMYAAPPGPQHVLAAPPGQQQQQQQQQQQLLPGQQVMVVVPPGGAAAQAGWGGMGVMPQ